MGVLRRGPLRGLGHHLSRRGLDLLVHLPNGRVRRIQLLTLPTTRGGGDVQLFAELAEHLRPLLDGEAIGRRAPLRIELGLSVE